MKFNKGTLYYTVPIILAIISGVSNLEILHQAAQVISDIFIRIFSFLSLPMIGLSVIVTIAAYPNDYKIKHLSTKILKYTFSTTIVAAITACILYIIIQPTSFI